MIHLRKNIRNSPLHLIIPTQIMLRVRSRFCSVFWSLGTHPFLFNHYDCEFQKSQMYHCKQLKGELKSGLRSTYVLSHATFDFITRNTDPIDLNSYVELDVGFTSRSLRGYLF